MAGRMHRSHLDHLGPIRHRYDRTRGGLTAPASGALSDGSTVESALRAKNPAARSPRVNLTPPRDIWGHYDAQVAGVGGAPGETLQFDDGALALEHGVWPWAPEPDDAPEPTSATDEQE